MTGRRTPSFIALTERQEQILRQLAKGTHVKLHYKQRAQYILLANDGMNNSAISRECDCIPKTVRKWRDRWAQNSKNIDLIEQKHPHKLKSYIQSILEDEQRPGAPQKFGPEQVAQILALACETPESLGLPFTHWSNSLLAQEAIKRNIVDTISPRHVGRLLDSMDIHPHKVQGWLNPKIEDPDEFRKQVEEICETYRDAPEQEEEKTHVICTDEMTGIQALERRHPSHPMSPGYPERYEFAYDRHGTSGIIASRNVTTGEIITPLIQPERKEVDFLTHFKQVVEIDPEAKYVFIMDQLNIHQSESLVRYVAKQCQMDIDDKTLGIKGKSGILKSMETRREFLSNPEHDIRIIYTPKHCSWLNQIEIWFSILRRHLLNRRASFTSVEELENRISQYIEFYNENLAKPFRWTYEGKLLQA